MYVILRCKNQHLIRIYVIEYQVLSFLSFAWQLS